MNLKKVSCIILSLVLLFSCNLAVSASEMNEPPRAVRGMCLKCSWFTSIVCQNSKIFDGRTEHKASGTTCTINWYNSTSVDVCGSCGTIYTQYGQHPCIKEHSRCSKGIEKICTIGYYPSN